MNNSTSFDKYKDNLNENSRINAQELNNQFSLNIEDYSNCKFELKELISKENDYSSIIFLVSKNIFIIISRTKNY